MVDEIDVTICWFGTGRIVVYIPIVDGEILSREDFYFHIFSQRDAFIWFLEIIFSKT